MGEEDFLDIFGRDVCFEHAAHGSDAAVKQIETTIHDQQSRRLGAFET